MRGYTTNLKTTADEITEKLIAARGLVDCAEHDPRLLPDGVKAANMILDSLSNGEAILIYGDYDCDGIMSTSIMYKYLSSRSPNVSYYIPDRFKEGYGMNLERLKKIVEDGKTKTIVTVDNGISAVEQVKFLKEHNIRVIVTDHHTCPQELPEADAIVNCHLANSTYPYNDLCGAGVAYKMVSLIESMSPSGYNNFEELKDMAAVATIADVVPLTGENRAIVKERLPLLSKTSSNGIAAIIRTSSSLYSVSCLTAENVAFSISPLINSSSRMGSAEVAMKLMLSDTIEDAFTMAQKLQNLNTARKIEEDKISLLATRSIITFPSVDCDYPIVVYGKDWNIGVIGIVAARIAEKFRIPAFVCSLSSDGMLHGSARSYGDFNIINALTSAGKYLTSFGGHPGAGGFSLKLENFKPFKNAIMEHYLDSYDEDKKESIVADAELDLTGISVDTVKDLSGQLGPFGEANREPVFVSNELSVVKVMAIGKDKNTLKLVVKDNENHLIDCIGFNMGYYSSILVEGDKISLAYRLQINEFNGQYSVQASIKDIDSERVNKLIDSMEESWPDIYNSYKTSQFSFVKKDDVPKDNEYINSFVAIKNLAENMVNKKSHISLEEATLWVNRMSGIDVSPTKMLLILSVVAESKNLAIKMNRNKSIFFAKYDPPEDVIRLSATKLYNQFKNV